jgi:hypothetical protein
MSLKPHPEPGPEESPRAGGTGAGKATTTETTATTAPHSQLTGTGECSPPPSAAAPRYIDDKDIRVLNSLLDDLKRLDAHSGEERLELHATRRGDSASGGGVLQSADGDGLLEPRGGHAEQVTHSCVGASVIGEQATTVYIYIYIYIWAL